MFHNKNIYTKKTNINSVLVPGQCHIKCWKHHYANDVTLNAAFGWSDPQIEKLFPILDQGICPNNINKMATFLKPNQLRLNLG